jgi:hypothetical protein
MGWMKDCGGRAMELGVCFAYGGDSGALWDRSKNVTSG